MKPDWKDAPEHAQFLAQDGNGDWYWYEKRPVWGGIDWQTDGYSWIAQFPPNPSARKTLEERPQ